MDNNIFNLVIIVFIVIIGYKIYTESDSFNLRCIVSDVNGNKYCVRERNKLELAADRLATINIKMNQLVAHVGEKYPKKENVKRLVTKYNPRKISETLPTSEYTAYSENKGQKIALCLQNPVQRGFRELSLN